MAKNMIRKSLAVGAASALVAAGFASPAQAAGLADTSFVSLAPTTGAEYRVLTGASKTFSLTANEATTIAGAGRNLKFLVADADSVIEPTIATTGEVVAVADNAVVLITAGAAPVKDKVTITDATLAGKLSTGAKIYFTADLNGDDGAGAADDVLASDDTIFEVTVSGNNVTFETDQEIGAGAGTVDAIDGAGEIQIIRDARATDGSYVVDSGSATDTANETLVLSTSGSETATRSVTVTAWVDANGNDVIDSTEYASPVRTVYWHKASDVTATATMETQIVGATSIAANIATTPTLNGNQMSSGDVTAKFTVQGSPTTFDASSSVWNNTTKVWKATLTRTHNVDSTTFADSVVTMKFEADHDLTTGETITVAGMDDAGNNGTFVVTKKDADEITFTNANGVADDTDAPGTATVAVVAGAYSATAYIGTTAVSGKTSNSVTAVTTTQGSTAVAEDANNNVTVDGNGDATVVVRPTTKAVNAVMSFADTNDVAVTAGRPVVLTVAITNATGVTVNGTAVTNGGTVNAVTDANGQVAVAVTTTSGVAADVVKVTGVAEGVAGSSTFAQWTWTAASYTLHDVNGAGTARSIAKGGAYSFDFLIADQWAQAQTGDLRLKVAVSGNTVSETYPAISAGRASVTVSDAQIGTSNVSVVVTPQKKQTDGTWGTTGTASAVTYTLYPAAQSGAAVTAVSGDTSVPFPTTALVAGDSRLTQTAVTTDGTAGTDAIEITGVVSDALTGVVKSGAAVTVSGPATLLFVDGTRASYGSITLFADANGAYSVHVRSNTAQKDSVVTVAAQGGSKTIKVSFEAADDNSGTSLTISAPDYVMPGSTFIATATLTDKFGNPVAVTDNADNALADFKATYTGPGLNVGSLPVTVDANGQAKVAVLLGSNDTGSIVVTFSYDKNGDEDYLDTGDLVVSKTITIGEAPSTVEQKVNAGSFKGYVAIYARGYEGSRLSAKVGADWVVVPSIVNNQEDGTLFRVVEYTGAGYDISVRIYIDRVLVDTIALTTK